MTKELHRLIKEADALLRVGDVARLTGLDERTIRIEADSGELPVSRVGRGRHRRFQLSVVRAYCERVGIRVRF